MSQLDLASRAEVSQRHLSFLETGRSQPSREMVIHLGHALDLGLRDRNTLLNAAGFAAVYRERGLDDPALDQVREVLATILRAHSPFPAYVVDRRWDLLMVNDPALALVSLIEPPPPPEMAGNVARLSLHPDGLRTMLRNWDEVASVLMGRLTRESVHRPDDAALAALIDEVGDYPGVPDGAGHSPLPQSGDLVVPLHASVKGAELRFVATIATIGAPFDITLEELRLETLLPLDVATTEFLHHLADSGVHG